jgi:hypothetical protein
MRLTPSSLLICLACVLPTARVAAERGHCSLVELRVSAQTSSGEVPVTGKTPLRKGDKLRLDLRPLRNTYVYVIHVSPRGTATLLYASREQPLQAGTRLVLPATGAYELDSEAGQEMISVIASETALDSVSPEHARIVKAVEEEHRLPAGARLVLEALPPQPQRPAATAARPQAAPEPQSTQATALRNTRATGVQDLYGDMRGFSNLPTAVAVRAANGVAVASVQLNHVQ